MTAPTGIRGRDPVMETPRSAAIEHADLLRRAADRLTEKDAHVPGPNDDGIRYCETCKYAWPCPPVQAAPAAIIEVWHGGPHSKSWPTVERVPGGWQSGANHYPDGVVARAWPYLGSREMRDALAACLYGQASRIESLAWGYSTVLVPQAWIDVAETVLGVQRVAMEAEQA